MTAQARKFKPQPGFQEKFLSTPADIAIAGSGAGVGKTFSLLLESIRHITNPNFGAVIFRKTFAQIKNTGGLWDESKKLFPGLKARPNETDHEWKFPSGSSIKFSHLQYDKDCDNHQGGQYPLIIFDEITHFSSYQFWYMLSRNRSTCGVKPYIRGTCNPDPDSFVAKLIEWWIDQETGFPIPERSGKIRYFVKDGDNIAWGDSKDEVLRQVPHLTALEDVSSVNPYDLVKSFTFIPGNIYENKELLRVNPQYLANLLSQDESERLRFLQGNWKVKIDGLALFDWKAIQDIFTNYPESDGKETYITCDAARFGRDFAVIMVWKGWELLKTIVLRQSESIDIVKTIEEQRSKYRVSKSNVIIDQDGVGGGTVKLGGYEGFSGGAKPEIEYETMIKENYINLKTQCFYRLAENHVNIGDIRLNINNENVVIDGLYTTKIKVGTQVKDIKDLIKEDFKAIKRKDPDNEGKKRINTKEEQKIILGRSPDFADCIMMRQYFDLLPKRRRIATYG